MKTTAGERLRKWRGKRSQTELAKLLGVRQSTVCRLEQDAQHPTDDLARLIEKLAGIKADSWERLVYSHRAMKDARS